MAKKIIFFFVLLIISLGVYFYLKKEPEIKITEKKIQNKFCFCSEGENNSLTACFNPTGEEFAVWNSKFNIALAPFKIPFRSGTWEKDKDKIKITFSNNEEFEIQHNFEKNGAFPSQINLKEVKLKPEFCENLDWAQLPDKFESSPNMGFYCSDDEKELKINLLIDFKKNIFSEFTGESLNFRESIFVEEPSETGVYQRDGDLLIFHTSHGREKQGKVTKWEIENKIPQIIIFGSGEEAIKIERNKCPWIDKSIRNIPLVTAKNILCEKKQNDLVLSILPDQKINIYFKTSSFSFKDFIDDKFSIQGTELKFTNNIITFKKGNFLIKGFFEKDGERIKYIKIPKGPKIEELEYSREFCPAFYLTDKLWK